MDLSKTFDEQTIFIVKRLIDSIRERVTENSKEEAKNLDQEKAIQFLNF